jgi:hypothetical protein
MRFITLCWTARTGNVAEMIHEAFDKVQHMTNQRIPLSLSDWYACKLLIEFSYRFNYRKAGLRKDYNKQIEEHNKTPLF